MDTDTSAFGKKNCTSSKSDGQPQIFSLANLYIQDFIFPQNGEFFPCNLDKKIQLDKMLQFLLCNFGFVSKTDNILFDFQRKILYNDIIDKKFLIRKCFI